MVKHLQDPVPLPGHLVVGDLPVAEVFRGEIHARPVHAIRVLCQRQRKDHGDAIETVVVVNHEDAVIGINGTTDDVVSVIDVIGGEIDSKTRGT